MARPQDLDELFYGLDTEIRKLLTLVHEIKIDIILQKDVQNKVERAIVLSRRIQDELRVLRWDMMTEKVIENFLEEVESEKNE